MPAWPTASPRSRRLLLRAVLACALLSGLSAVPARAVVGGAPVSTPGYMAMVLAASSGGGSYTVCGGTAISRNVVLTAAHCVIDEQTRGVVPASRILTLFGRDDALGAVRDRSAAFNPVVAVVSAPAYARLANGGATNDVALLQLRDPVSAVLPLAPQDRADLTLAGRPATFLGWGLTDGRDGASMSSSLRSGNLLLGLAAACGAGIHGYDPQVMLCGTGSGPSSPCQGDSGGPLIVSDPADQARYVAGVVSFVEQGCPVPGGPPVFANVAGATLGSLVAAEAARLQQAADARGTASGPRAAAASTAPAATRGVRAGLSRGDALARVRSNVRRATGRTPVFSRYACTRTAATSFTCRPRWRDRRFAYAGRLTVSERSATFRGTRTLRTCRPAATTVACAKTFRFAR